MSCLSAKKISSGRELSVDELSYPFYAQKIRLKSDTDQKIACYNSKVVIYERKILQDRAHVFVKSFEWNVTGAFRLHCFQTKVSYFPCSLTLLVWIGSFSLSLATLDELRIAKCPTITILDVSIWHFRHDLML